MDKDAYGLILAEVLQAAEQGRPPELEEVLARHPGHETTVHEVLEAFGVYSRLRADAISTPVHESLETGLRLGDFEIIDSLAQGGMGAVYRARQLALGGRVVALKALPGDTASERTVARFEREARTLAKLHHPNLAEVYGFGEERGTFYYAMRLISGPTLREVLQHRSAARRMGHPDPPDQRRALVERMVEVADALAVVHQAGAVHRDIKPANIVFEGGSRDHALDSAAVLVDFGLVRFTGSSTLTQTGDSPGTPTYAPPEQLLGRDVDSRADVFSLGVTLHDLLARRGPEERAQASSGLEPLRSIDPTIDADLSAVVGMAADPEPLWRYADAAGLRDDLVAWLKGYGVTARSMPWTERTRRWTTRHPRRVTQLALAFVAMVVAIAGITIFGRVLGSISNAREMLRQWDLPALDRELAGIPSWIPLGFVAEEDLADAARRLRARDQADPLVRIHSVLRENKLEEALNIATTAVQTEGFGGDPLITDFLIHEFEARRTAPGSHERPWAVFAARLFYEKPVFEPADITRVEPYRQALTAIWQRDDLDSNERRYLLTAESGCSRPEELPEFLIWSLEHDRTPEERRIVLGLTDQVIRRAWRCGQLADLDLEVVWLALRRTWSDWSNLDRHQLPWGCHEALSRACRTTVLANRELGRDALLPTLPSADRTRFLQSEILWAPLRIVLDSLAAAGSPELLAALQAGSSPALILSLACEDPEQLGRLCSLLPLEHRGGVAAGWRSSRSQSWISGFNRGWAYGDGLTQGIDPELMLDEDTYLGRADSMTAVLERQCETPWVGWDPSEAYSKIGGGLARSLREPLLPIERQPEVASDSAPSPDALWRFHGKCVSHAGTAAGEVSMGAGSLEKEGNSGFARLGVFGKSVLQFEFDVPTDSLGTNRLLSLGLQTNVRQLYPQMGIAHILLELDGTEIATAPFGSPECVEQSFPIPPHALKPGRNEISIRLMESSTTPLRVHWAAVWSMPAQGG